jgi:hypothetical protein
VREGDIADRLAQALDWSVLAGCGFRDGLLWLAAHARVLRREDVASHPVAAALAAARRSDPLSALPLSPLPLERGALLPSFTPEGAHWVLPFGRHVEGLSPAVPTESHLVPRPVTRAAAPAFSNWARAAAATGSPAGHPSPEAAAGAFAALLPEPSHDAGGVRAREIAPADAWSYLFCGALAGDAAPRRSLAGARLAAWVTLAGLAEAPPAPAEVERRLEGSRWYVLSVDGPWFGRRARDAALVGVLGTHWCALAASE